MFKQGFGTKGANGDPKPQMLKQRRNKRKKKALEKHPRLNQLRDKLFRR